MTNQSILLSKLPHIVIATPGRLAAHLKNRASTFSLQRIKFLVLDEADRLFEDSFSKDMKTILNQISKKKTNIIIFCNYDSSFNNFAIFNTNRSIYLP